MGVFPFQGKTHMVEPGIEPGTSWLVVRNSDHQATRLVSFLLIFSHSLSVTQHRKSHILSLIRTTSYFLALSTTIRLNLFAMTALNTEARVVQFVSTIQLHIPEVFPVRNSWSSWSDPQQIKNYWFYSFTPRERVPANKGISECVSYFNRRRAIVFLILQIKWFYAV